MLLRLKNNPLVINTAKLSGSSIILYLLPVIVTPILSRMYNMSAFAEWGIFSSITSIATLGLFLGLENAIVKVEEDKVKDIVMLCLLTAFIVIFLAVIVAVMCQLLGIYDVKLMASPILLLLYFIFYCFYTILYAICNRYELYTSLSLGSILQGVVQALLRISFGLFPIMAVNGLILGVIGAQSVVVFFLLIVLFRNKQVVDIFHASFHINRLNILLKENRNFPLFDAPSGVLAFAAFNLPLLILNHYFSNDVVGCYTIVLQLMLMPMSFVGGAIGRVYYQRICVPQSDEELIKKTTQEVAKFLSMIAVLPIILIALGGDHLIVLYLGSRWQAASTIAMCLSVWSFSIILTQPLLPIFRKKNLQKTLLCYDSVYFCVAILSIYIGCQYTSSLSTVLFAYSILCALVKVSLYYRILKVAHISSDIWNGPVRLWLIAFLLLIIRVLWEV